MGAPLLPLPRSASLPTATAATIAGASANRWMRAAERPGLCGLGVANTGTAASGMALSRPRSKSRMAASCACRSIARLSAVTVRTYLIWSAASTTMTTSWSKKACRSLARRSTHWGSYSTRIAWVARSVAATLSISCRTCTPRSAMASSMSCCSRLSEASSARRADVTTATATPTMATAKMTPSGTTSRRRVGCQRDRLSSPAIFSRAEPSTVQPFERYLVRCDNGQKRLPFACRSTDQGVTAAKGKSEAYVNEG